MNPYRVIILLTLFLRFALTISEWFSIRKMDDQLPDEVKDVYDEEKFRKSKQYLNTSTTFRLVQDTFSLTLLLLFWFLGGFEALDRFVRGLNWHPTLTGIAYIGILGAVSSILTLPFTLYFTFVIEERFGFNRTTWKLFFIDRIKGLILACALGIPFLAMVFWFFETMGELAWLYCWAIAAIISLLLAFVAPKWIMPLFNKFTPLQEGELVDAITNYAKSVGFAFRDIFVIDSSKRTSKTNAFFTGFGRNKRIALFDTLVSDSTTPEIVAVLAHEIGHYKKKHIPLSMILGLLNTGLIFYLLSLFVTNRTLFEAFYVREVSVYAGLVFFGMLYEPISFLLSLPLNALSRRNEMQADRYAVDTIPDRETLVSALKKMYSTNLGNLKPHPLYVILHYSHPPLLQRIHKIRES